MLTIFDEVYKEQTISHPFLEELYFSAPVRRLQWISQCGLPSSFSPFVDYTRFHHSVGVMFLLKKLGASIEEQAAGLLHDVSHTTFSHIIDNLLSNDTEDFQDGQHKRYITESMLPQITSKYGFEVRSLYNFDDFSLLEQPAPELCADRVDYTLRECALRVDRAKARACAEHLVNYEDKIVFDSFEPASFFAHLYYRFEEENWSNLGQKIRWEIFVRALKQGLDKEIITLSDFWTTDLDVIGKLSGAQDPLINRYFTFLSMQQCKVLYEERDDKESDSAINMGKRRYVDPSFLKDGALLRVSQRDDEYQTMLRKQEREWRKTKMVCIPGL